MKFNLDAQEVLFKGEQEYFPTRDKRFYIYDCHSNISGLDFYSELINEELQNGNDS